MDKKSASQFLLLNFREMMHHFSLRLQNSECPRIFQGMGANQNVQKLLSTDLVNTNDNYHYCYCFWPNWSSFRGLTSSMIRDAWYSCYRLVDLSDQTCLLIIISLWIIKGQRILVYCKHYLVLLSLVLVMTVIIFVNLMMNS